MRFRLSALILWLIVGIAISQAWAQSALINGSRVLVGTLNFCADAGSTDAYACNLSPAITTYTTGARYTFKANTGNTGAATLALNGLAAKTIKKMAGGITTDLATGDICAGQYVDVLYDGTNLEMTSQLCADMGKVNSGVAGAITYYPASTTTVDDSSAMTVDGTTILTKRDAVTAVSANTTLGTHNIVYCTAGGTDKTMTLPAASSTTVGYYRVIKADSGAGACIVAPNGSDTLNGVNGSKSATTQWSQVEVTWTTTTNWHAVAGKTAMDLAADITGTLPVANGGTGTSSTLTGLMRGSATAMTAAELSGDCVTSGSNAVTCSKLNNLAPFTVNPQTGTYQVVAADFSGYKTITVASGTFTITLVASGSQPANGQSVRVINYGSGVVTVARSGQNLNGGTTSLTIPASSATAPTALTVVSDGTNYFASLDSVGSGNAATATALAANGANCAVAGTFPNGVDASGAAENCVALSGAISPQTTTYQVLAADFSGYKVIPVSSGTFTITLVASGSQPAAGQYIDIVNYGSGIVTVARSGQNINGGTTSLTLPAGTATEPTSARIVSNGTDYFANTNVLTAASVTTLTNKTLDVEGTGNSITTVSKVWLPAAACQNATATLLWDTPTSSPAVAACITGTNTQKGVADFADSANLSMQQTLMLPADWSGAIDARFKWLTTATSGDVVWQLATICVADAETDDPAFNTASTVTDTAKGTTNQTNDATITGLTTTGCAAGELLHLKVSRDSAHASDTLAATARLIGLELTLRRTQ